MLTTARVLKGASALVLLLALPAPASAWGASAHRYIMQRAIDLLPPELKPFFEANRAEVVMRVNDPDLWRSVGWDEDANHFVDFGVDEYGPYPFDALPREHGAAIEKFGQAGLKKNGLLPWREEEIFGNLRRAFAGFKTNSKYSITDAILFSAVGSHYLQDAHQPLHATNNYDGQMTGQQGIHSRFETELFDRFQSRLTITPAPPSPITNARDTAFGVLLASFQSVRTVLDADKAASEGKDAYDDDYFEKLFVALKPLLERRLGESITASAAFIVGAWEAAGRPEVKTSMPPAVQKIRRPK